MASPLSSFLFTPIIGFTKKCESGKIGVSQAVQDAKSKVKLLDVLGDCRLNVKCSGHGSASGSTGPFCPPAHLPLGCSPSSGTITKTGHAFEFYLIFFAHFIITKDTALYPISYVLCVYNQLCSFNTYCI